MAGRLSSVINYTKINESNKEFRRTDYWLIEITAPKGVYFPGNDLIQIRCNSFSSGISDEIEIMEKQIRTFTIKQGAKPTNTGGQLSLTMIDRVDQTIAYWLDQWKQAIGSRDRLEGLEKELYVSPVITATFYNIDEKPLRVLRFFNCIPNGTLPEDGSESPELEGDISLEFSYEHFERDFKNVSFPY